MDVTVRRMTSISVPVRMIMYDMMYAMADTLIKAENPCKIHTDLKRGVLCARDEPPCCGGCEYLNSNGCTVKCLRCKLFLCGPNTALHYKLSMMRNIGWKFDLLAMRTSRSFIRDSLRKQHKRSQQLEEVWHDGN